MGMSVVVAVTSNSSGRVMLLPDSHEIRSEGYRASVGILGTAVATAVVVTTRIAIETATGIWHRNSQRTR